MFRNKDIRRNVIAIGVCIILELIGIWLYLNWIKIGEDTLVITKHTSIKPTFYDTFENIYGKEDTARYKMKITSRHLTIPFNNGGLNNKKNSIENRMLMKSNVMADKDTSKIIIPIHNNTFDSLTGEWDSRWGNAKRVKEDNYLSVQTISFSSSLPRTQRNMHYDSTTIDSINENFIATKRLITEIKRHRLIRYESISKVSCKVLGGASKYIDESLYIRQLCVPPKWYRLEDLSRRVICLDLTQYEYETIPYEDIVINLYGPFRIISSDIQPNETTMTKMIFNQLGSIVYGNTSIWPDSTSSDSLNPTIKPTLKKMFIEFPYMEHVQEARILALTTLMISVLLTLILNCFIAVGKIVRRENKMKKFSLDSIPCYGSFSDCSECSMYNTCSYRPTNRTYYRTHRKPHISHQEKNESKSD